MFCYWFFISKFAILRTFKNISSISSTRLSALTRKSRDAVLSLTLLNKNWCHYFNKTYNFPVQKNSQENSLFYYLKIKWRILTNSIIYTQYIIGERAWVKQKVHGTLIYIKTCFAWKSNPTPRFILFRSWFVMQQSSYCTYVVLNLKSLS